MNDEPCEVDDEEVMGVPEDLEVAPADELRGRRAHEDKCQGDDHPCETWNGDERNNQRSLQVKARYVL